MSERTFEIGDIVIINGRLDEPALFVSGVIHDQRLVFVRDETKKLRNGGELRFEFDQVTNQYREVAT